MWGIRLSRRVSKRSSGASEVGGTEPIIPTVYPWERETDIYSRERFRARVYTTSVKLANFLLSKKNQRAAQQIY